MDACNSYLENVYKSIKKNIKSLRNEDEALQKLLGAIQQFYVSLFAKDSGFFGSKDMDRKLQKIPDVRPKPTRDRGGAQETPQDSGKGLGTGKPGHARKPEVTKRQERRRSGSSFTTARKRPSSTSAKEPPAKKIAPKQPRPSASTSSASRSASPPQRPPASEPSEPSTSSPSVPELPPEEPPEERQKLRAQVLEPPGKTTVARIQTIAKAVKDKSPNSKELELYWEVMDRWTTKLDPTLSSALQAFWNDIVRDKDTALEEKILKLVTTPNAVSNCIRHLIGNLVREHAKSRGRLGNMTKYCEDLADSLEDLRSQEYTLQLQKCSCDKCQSVQEFDDHYVRYHDSIESENREVTVDSPVLFKDRPAHCETTELFAQIARTQFAGLSSSNLQKWYYFANTTPLFSPPTLTQAPPTAVLTTTLKYLEPFLRERKLQDPLPCSWWLPAAISDQHHLISVPKASIHLYDADSGEIASSQDVPELERLATHGNTIRFRMLNSDSPETEYSIRIYKQSEHNVQMSPFLTRHIGIECMRAARQMLFEATAVYLGVGEDHRGELLLQRDHHGRMLVNIFLEDSNGEKENFAQKLASHGYTLSFYTTGIESGINQAMREAIAAKIGIFNLPDEAFAYPFRPWDVRTLTRKEAENPIDYDAKREILNTPSDPASAWKPQGTITPVDGGEEDGSMPESESTDTFFLKMVTCKLFFETKCFAARSTIPNAGTGLFIKPHRTIPVGQHLCLYAEQSTEPMETSSKVYAMQTARHNLHFDAEIETGNNIGRFANQPGVMEAFDQIKEMSHKDKPQMTEDDWRRIEKELNDMCNAEFSVVLGQLVLKAKRQFDETFNATEVFVNYGGLREYWIPLIMQRNTSDLVPNRMIEIVEWLFHSEECNWTQEQRRDWSAR